MSISLTSTTWDVAPKVLQKMSSDRKDQLYKASLPNTSVADNLTLPDDAGDIADYGFIYSNKKYRVGQDIKYTPAWLKNEDGATAFSLNTTDTDVVSLVSNRDGLSLFVYSPNTPGTTTKYTFDSTGVYQDSSDLSALELADAEISSTRDLDGNGKIGALVDATLDSTGGLYKVTVAGQDFYVAGSRLDRARTLDVSKTALLNADGTAWDLPDGTASVLKSKEEDYSWEVFVNDADGTVTRYRFDQDRLLADETDVSALELARSEKSHKRDIDSDGVYGVAIEATPIDSVSGLYKGTVLGEEFLLVGSKLASGTARKPMDLQGALLNSIGEAWTPTEGLTVQAALKEDGIVSLYAANDADENEILKFQFVLDADSQNYVIDDGYVEGEIQDSIALSAAEKISKRDLNNDTFYGVQVVGDPLDRTGGLYLTQSLGSSFIVVGKGLVSSEKTPLDLSQTLKDGNGSAWAPDAIDLTDRDSFLMSVVETDSGYDVVVIENFDAADQADRTPVLYQFGSDFELSADRIELSQAELANLEATQGRDLNGDTAIGIRVSTALDYRGGLYKGSFGTDNDIYLRSTTRLQVGSTRASLAKDYDGALQTPAGELWSPEEGFTANAGFDIDNSTFAVVASEDAGDSVRQYTFTLSNDNVWTLDESAETTVDIRDIVAKEKSLKRDLDGDGQVAHAVTRTVDKVGKLYELDIAGTAYLTYSAVNPKSISNYDSALTTESGSAWAPTDGYDRLTFVSNDSGGYYAFEKHSEGYTRYEFDANYTEIAANTVSLSLVELSKAETEYQRDMNGDRATGAKITTTHDRIGGLHEATLDGETFTVFVSNPSPRGVNLGTTAFIDSDGITPWAVDNGYNLKAALQDDDNDQIKVYAVNTADSSDIKRYTFDADRVLLTADSLTAEELSLDEEIFDRDLNTDKAIGLSVTDAIDRRGGLFKATVLGEEYYVLGTNDEDAAVNLRTKSRSGSGADTAPNFSKTLLDGSRDPWSPEEGYTVAGVIKDDDANWNVYSFKIDEDNDYLVRRSVWNSDLDFQGTVDADPVALVELEAEEGRDFSGDAKIGFRTTAGANDVSYDGVTQVKISGKTGFWVVGADRKTGTATNPIRLNDALLSADGTGPWIPDDGYLVKSVRSDGENQYVYAVKPADADSVLSSVYKYTFSSDGVWDGEAPAVLSPVELAAEEKEFNQDLDRNADTDNGVTDSSVIGAAFLSDVQVNNKSIGLIKATSMGGEFYLVRSAPSTSEKFDLTAALLNADGSAWRPNGADETDSDTGIGASFTPKGLYTFDDEGVATVELYGTNGLGQTEQFKFQKDAENADDSSYYLVDIDDEEDTPFSQVIAGATVAEREAAALRDLNGDSSIGFKYEETKARQSNGFNLATAQVAYVDTEEAAQTDTIYFVGKTPERTGATSSNLANSSALYGAYTDAENFEYWVPDDGYSVVSLHSESETVLHVFAQNADQDRYLKYSFEKADGNWVASTAELQDDGYAESEDSIDNTSDNPLTQQSIVAEEVFFKRDLNEDGAVGLTKTEAFGTQLIKATAGGDTTYLIAGSNVATGSALYPLGYSGLLRSSDGAAKWLPGTETDYSNLSISGFGQVNSSMDAPEGAEYRLVGQLNSEDVAYYFDAEFQLVEE